MTAPAELTSYFARRGIALLETGPGVSTPAFFTDPVAEHMATRRAAGLFDFSFMACMELNGPGSLDCLRRLQTRSLSSLRPGRLAYTLLLRDDGSIINDATVWQLAEDRYLVFSGRLGDLQHAAALACGLELDIADRSRMQSVIAIQGQASWAVIQRCFADSVPALPARLPYYGFAPVAFRGAACLLARIGYSGETGYELVAPAGIAPALWQALLQAGADRGLTECGFRAIDTLRIEAGHILFMNELARPVTPFEIGLARLVDFHGTPCAGVAALRGIRWRAPERILSGLLPDADSGRAAGSSAAGRPDAQITSTCVSPVLGRRIALGFVAAADRHPGTRVRLASGNAATVARLPFYDPARHLARRSA